MLISPIPIACQPEAIGIALILEVDQEFEGSVYSRNGSLFRGVSTVDRTVLDNNGSSPFPALPDSTPAVTLILYESRGMAVHSPSHRRKEISDAAADACGVETVRPIMLQTASVTSVLPTTDTERKQTVRGVA